MKQKLVDWAEFSVIAGRGGHGSIHFRREKYKPKGGPDGGNGGKGGDVIIRASRHLSTLRQLSGRDRFEAGNGIIGGGSGSSGDDGENVVIEVPVGTVVWVKSEDCRLLRGRRLYGDDVERIVKSGYKVDRVPYLNFSERFSLANDKIQNSNDNIMEDESKGQTPDGQEDPSIAWRRTGAKRTPANGAGRQDDELDYMSLSSSSNTTNGEWVEVADLDRDGTEMVIARGGRGGLGNVTFKGSRNTTPKVAQRGEWGEQFAVRLELKVLADVGLVGLPNVGKSTLLSVLTAAKPEIANYPFTTLSPNLGVLEVRSKMQDVRSIVIADIPGLIEDAHKGKGLGTDFLRHIERCRLIAYIIAPTEEMLTECKSQNAKVKITSQNSKLTEQIWKQYQTVKREVESYGRGLAEKPFVVVVNKVDIVTSDQRQATRDYFRKKGVEVVMVSAATTEGINELKRRVGELVGRNE